MRVSLLYCQRHTGLYYQRTPTITEDPNTLDSVEPHPTTPGPAETTQQVESLNALLPGWTPLVVADFWIHMNETAPQQLPTFHPYSHGPWSHPFQNSSLYAVRYHPPDLSQDVSHCENANYISSHDIFLHQPNHSLSRAASDHSASINRESYGHSPLLQQELPNPCDFIDDSDTFNLPDILGNDDTGNAYETHDTTVPVALRPSEESESTEILSLSALSLPPQMPTPQPPIEATPSRSYFTCTICKKAFKLNCELRRHMCCHTKPFSCDSCDTRFGSWKDLKRHAGSHSSEKRHRCSDCGFRANRKDSLLRHGRTQHGWGQEVLETP